MPAGESKSIVRRYFEDLWNQGDASVADDIFTSDLSFHGLQAMHGREEFKQFMKMLRTAFPDLHFTIEDEFGAGDKAAGRFTMRGTHRGNFLGIPATGREIKVSGIDIFHMPGGRIREIWVAMDGLGLMRQIGAQPNPNQP